MKALRLNRWPPLSLRNQRFWVWRANKPWPERRGVRAVPRTGHWVLMTYWLAIDEANSRRRAAGTCK
jgi:hypothetical protein